MKIKVIILYSLFCVISITSDAQINEQHPNILFIAIDDLKPTIGSFGDSFAQTPVMDALSSEATVFLNNHTQQAVCGPSRASLMTGKRPDYTKVRDLKTKMRAINPDILTIPEYFKNNGYHTVGIGKIYDPRCVDDDRDKPSWSVPFIKEGELEYSKTYGAPVFGYYQNKAIKNQIRLLRAEAKAKGKKNINKHVRNQYKPPFGSADVPDEAYVDGAIAEKAKLLLQDLSKDQSTPFFLAVGFKRPHLPFTAPQKYWDQYNRNAIDLAKYQKKSTHGPDIAYHSSGEMRSYKTLDSEYTISDDKLLKLDEDFQKKLIHGYYACTSYIDTQLGKILTTLKETGLDKNTIIVVWGDHGWHLGDHSLWCKHSNFEQATRSPLIIYNPKIKKAVKVTSPTEFVDIFPTLCEAANLRIPENLDGQSLNSLVEGQNISPKSYAVSQWHSGHKSGYSFRTEQYRYTVWITDKKSTDPIFKKDVFAEELYDYVSDPLETYNRIDDEAHTKLKQRFQKLAASYFNSQQKKSKTSSATPTSKTAQKNKLIIGATLGYKELDSEKGELFLKDFKYLTPSNGAKQAIVHSKPGVWNWKRTDMFIDFAKRHNLDVRLHGPISPQASPWAKEDHRTAEELESLMIEFATAFAKRFNKEPVVKWIDVVNETIVPSGEWFGAREGTKKWENPWVNIGFDENGFPKYITKAFEIATKYATNKKLVYNHHGGMQTKMWDKVKETILYVRSKGYRVDAVGWQGHLKLNNASTDFARDLATFLESLSDLIDWAHANELEFHITELDYRITKKSDLKSERLKQAEIYSKIITILESKTSTGVVGLNLWDMGTRKTFHSIYDADLNPTPAYEVIKKALNKSKQ
ncbi:MAG: Arylsulfatase [Formosa sp. Hel1_33_131]|nr:MAG: Arylsulfatase [Formosa sp. Hel1_33_131]